MSKFKPMLSATLDQLSGVQYPVYVSPKLDGIRCIIRNGVPVSRNLKPIPNLFVHMRLAGLPNGLDGELIVGPDTGDDVWNRTTSGVMTLEGKPNFTFHVFDFLPSDDQQDTPFYQRISMARDGLYMSGNSYAKLVTHHQISDEAGLVAVEEDYVSRGYEGVMLRSREGGYKFGRSTLKERGLMKLKRWHDAEAYIIDFVERMHNGNEATTDELGRTKRSSHKANKIGRGDLGAVVCDFNGVKFEIGSGFTDADRAMIWNNQALYLGKQITFKYQALTPDGIPRFPVAKGFRHGADLPKKERV